jgi:uncharacterized protein YndB with AHSA1/START domain
MTSTTAAQTVQVHRVYIKATPQAIWDAITKPEWTQRYGYGGQFESEPRTGRPYKSLTGDDMKKSGAEWGFEVPDVALDGEVIEANPPHRLVLTWRMLMVPPGATPEGFTRLTYEIDAVDGGYTKLTLVHDLAEAPSMAPMVAGEGEARGGGGGWPWVLSDLKSLLETGKSFAEIAN